MGIKHFPKFLQNWSFPKGSQCHPPCWAEKWHQCISATLLFHWTQCSHIYLQLGTYAFSVYEVFVFAICHKFIWKSYVNNIRRQIRPPFRLQFPLLLSCIQVSVYRNTAKAFSSVSVLCFGVGTGEASQFSLWNPLKYSASLQQLVRAVWDPTSRISVASA